MPSLQLDVQVGFARLDTPQFPGYIGVVRAPFLNVGDGFRLINSANSLFLFGVILDDCVTWKRQPVRGSKIKLGKSERALIEGMEEDVFRDLVGNVEGFLDEIDGQFEFLQDLGLLIVLL